MMTNVSQFENMHLFFGQNELKKIQDIENIEKQVNEMLNRIKTRKHPIENISTLNQDIKVSIREAQQILSDLDLLVEEMDDDGDINVSDVNDDNDHCIGDNEDGRSDNGKANHEDNQNEIQLIDNVKKKVGEIPNETHGDSDEHFNSLSVGSSNMDDQVKKNFLQGNISRKELLRKFVDTYIGNFKRLIMEQRKTIEDYQRNFSSSHKNPVIKSQQHQRSKLFSLPSNFQIPKSSSLHSRKLLGNMNNKCSGYQNRSASEQSKLVTTSLNRTRTLLAEQLFRTEKSMIKLHESSETMKKTMSEHDSYGEQLGKSKSVIIWLQFREKLNQYATRIAYYFFLLVCLYIFHRRIPILSLLFSIAMYIPTAIFKMVANSQDDPQLTNSTQIKEL